MSRRKQPKQAQPVALEPTLAAPDVTVKYDLACGQNKREGFLGIDIFKGADVVHNLMRYPWPLETSSVDELHCSHFIEHIPMIFVDDDGGEVPMGDHDARDAFFRFFDECHRVLKPDGWMTVIAPSARSNRAFQDPTHRRFIVGETFMYLNADWRKSQKLDHYAVSCHFEIAPQVTCDQILNTLHPEAHNRHINNYWNTTIDWHCRLKAVK